MKALFLLPLLLFTVSLLIKAIRIFIANWQKSPFSIFLVVSIGFSIIAISGLFIFYRIDFFFLNVLSLSSLILFNWLEYRNAHRDTKVGEIGRIVTFTKNNAGLFINVIMLYIAFYIAIITGAGIKIINTEGDMIALSVGRMLEEQKSVRSQQDPCFRDLLTVNYGMWYHTVLAGQEYDVECAVLRLITVTIENPLTQKATGPLYGQFKYEEARKTNEYDSDVFFAFHTIRTLAMLSEQYATYRKDLDKFVNNVDIGGKICQDFIGGQSYCLVREK